MSENSAPSLRRRPAVLVVPDVIDWPTKPEVAQMLGVSTKAVERFAQARQLEQRMRKQGRGPARVVYCPEDVARLAQRRMPKDQAFVVPAPTTKPSETVADMSLLSQSRSDIAIALLALLREVQPALASQTISAEFLTVAQAAQVTGLTMAYLQRAIREGRLPMVKDRHIKIRRRDLATL